MNSTSYLAFAGRLLIGVPFAMSGLSKLAAYGATTAMIGAVGLPVPPLAFAVAVAVELGGGLLLIAGFQTRIVAIALAVFSFATALSFHSNFADQNQMIHFLKNAMMAGGLLQVVAFGAGSFSLDSRVLKSGRRTRRWRWLLDHEERHRGRDRPRRLLTFRTPKCRVVARRIGLSELAYRNFEHSSHLREKSAPSLGLDRRGSGSPSRRRVLRYSKPLASRAAGSASIGIRA